MGLYSLHVFNRFGDQIFYVHWGGFAVKGGEDRLIGGFIYTLQHFASQLSATHDGRFKSVQTRTYKLHYFETLTGFRAALMTSQDVATDFIQDVLSDFFTNVFIPFITRNPSFEHVKGVFLNDPFFSKSVENYFRSKQLL